MVKNKKGFTLSEVLITLVIIGVIAAITVPVMHADYPERKRSAKVKKIYSTLANAMTFVKADGGDMIFEVDSDENLDTMRQWFDTYLKPRLITTKVCYNTKGCWNEKITKSLDGSTCRWNVTGVGIGSRIITAVLSDGTFINIDGHRRANLNSYFGVNFDEDYGIAVTFDINGAKEPNTIGKDIFVTVFTPDGIVPAYKDKTQAQINADCSNSGTGYSCINKYLRK